MARVVSSECLEDSAVQFCLKTVTLAPIFLAKTSRVASYDSRFMFALANYFTRTCHILVVATINVSTVYIGIKTWRKPHYFETNHTSESSRYLDNITQAVWRHVLLLLFFWFLYEYTATVGFHCSTGFLDFPWLNSTTVLWIMKCHQSLTTSTAVSRRWVKFQICVNCPFKPNVYIIGCIPKSIWLKMKQHMALERDLFQKL